MGVSYCLGPEEIGSARGKGSREGPAPQEAGKISSQCSARAGTTGARRRKTGQVRREEDGRIMYRGLYIAVRKRYLFPPPF
jgi:hypothetical protein